MYHMAEYAPKTLQDTYDRIELRSKRMGGIVGNPLTHFGGYHRGIAFCPAGDYSTRLVADRQADKLVSCALDVTFAEHADMALASKRLLAAFRNNDPRLRCWRAFLGSVDGQIVIGYDRNDPAVVADDRPRTGDKTHRWHIHLEGYRSLIFSNDVPLIADVINGKPLAGAHLLRRAWPAYMPAGHYFGLITGPAESHGGHFASERPDVMAIQQRLRMFRQPVAVDGRYGPATAAAVQWWQKAKYPSTVAAKLGKLDAVAWTRLFTY